VQPPLQHVKHVKRFMNPYFPIDKLTQFYT